MECQINYGLWGSVFAVPATVVDDLLPLSGESQLKVLLYLLRHAQASVSSEQIAEGLHLRIEVVEEAMTYWIGNGLLIPSSGSAASKKEIAVPKVATASGDIDEPKAAPKKGLISVRKRKDLPPLPTSTEAIRHFAENPALNDFQDVVEGALNRPITAHDLQVITWCLDVLAMPQEVFCLLCRFCALRGKASANQLKFTAEDWWEREIDSYQQAELYLADLEHLESSCENIRKLLGWTQPLTKNQEKMISSWQQTKGFSDKVIQHAFDIALDAGAVNPFLYTDKLLSYWESNGLKTLPAIRAYEEAEFPKREAIRCVRRAFHSKNPLSAKQEELAYDWMVRMQFSEEVLQKAVERARNAGSERPFSYVNRILCTWHEKGLTNLVDIEREELKRANSRSKQKTAGKKTASYDFSDIHHLLDDISEKK